MKRIKYGAEHFDIVERDGEVLVFDMEGDALFALPMPAVEPVLRRVIQIYYGSRRTGLRIGRERAFIELRRLIGVNLSVE